MGYYIYLFFADFVIIYCALVFMEKPEPSIDSLLPSLDRLELEELKMKIEDLLEKDLRLYGKINK